MTSESVTGAATSLSTDIKTEATLGVQNANWIFFRRRCCSIKLRRVNTNWAIQLAIYGDIHVETA